jgi:hypothetical protein
MRESVSVGEDDICHWVVCVLGVEKDEKIRGREGGKLCGREGVRVCV